MNGEFKSFDSIEEMFNYIEEMRATTEPEQVDARSALLYGIGAAMGAQQDIARLMDLEPTEGDCSRVSNKEGLRRSISTLISAKQRQAEVWVEVHDRLLEAEVPSLNAAQAEVLALRAELKRLNTQVDRFDAEEARSKADAEEVLRQHNGPAEDMTVWPEVQRADENGR